MTTAQAVHTEEITIAMTTHHSHSRRSQNVLCSQDCVIGDVGEHVPHNYRDHGHDDSQGDISTRKGNTHTGCYLLLCTLLLQILSGIDNWLTIDCSQVNPQAYSSCTALGKAAVPLRLVTQGSFLPALPFRFDQLFTHKAGLKPARWEEMGWESESCWGHLSAAMKRPPVAPTSLSMRTCLHRKPGGAYPEPETVCQKHPGSVRCGLQRR